MGGYFSHENEDESPENEEEYRSTPQPISSIAKIFTFINDPRSPSTNNVSRTPILVQEPLIDPRSPGNELVERTPLYDSTSTPIVRYKLDNGGYQASPVVQKEEELTGDNDGYIQSPSIPTEGEHIDSENTECDSKIENIHEDYDSEIIGEENEEVWKAVDEKLPEAGGCRENKAETTKNQLKKRFNATQKSFLKTVLFKPYEELSEDEINITRNGSTPERRPFGVRNDACANGDSAKKLVYEKKRLAGVRNSSVYKLPLRELSVCDKENTA